MAKHNQSKKIIKELLKKAGITVNGHNAWDFQVKNSKVYNRVLAQGSLGLGEAYIDGWWEAKELDEFFNKIISAKLSDEIKKNFGMLFKILLARIFNLQSEKRAFIVGKKHYDLGNDIYANMLDKRLTYTGAYWKNATNLDEAQEAKLDLVCRKLKLAPGMKILDIGCGWGSFIKYAAEKYGVSAVGITVSKEQLKLAKKLCVGLPVEIKLQDYRNLNEKFDHIVSLGMIEHVGYKNFKTYFKIINKCLKNNGLFLLQTIGSNYSVFSTDSWIEKYIFPNGMLPSLEQINQSIKNLFIIEDLHNFGSDYDKTLMAWFKNFENNWDNLKEKYGEKFFRMWKYYLLSSAGTFRARNIQLWQIVFSKKKITGGYKSIR